MAEIMLANGCIDLYVLHRVDEPNIVPMIDTLDQEAQQHRRKITLKRLTPKSIAPQLNLETGSPQTLLSHKDTATLSKQNLKDTTPIRNLKE